MAQSEPPELFELIEEFRKALHDCDDLYRSAAQDVVHSQPELSKEARRDYIHRMVDLHRGLLLKTFVEVAFVERRWSDEALELAEELFWHLYHKRLNREQVLEALDHYLQQSILPWDVLLGPFERMTILRGRATTLQSLVIRLANIVTKANGRVNQREIDQLKWIRAECKRVLERVPLAGDESEKPFATAGRQALKNNSYEIVPSKHASDDDLPVAELIEAESPEQILEEALAELDGLTGLTCIKQEIRSLINFLKIQKARVQFNLPQTPISLHAVFSGNPGTGKTTVARLLGRLYAGMGMLKRGHLVETDRAGLVAEYAGQTAPKAHKKIDEARDGVLFIDEAYSLVSEKGDDPYGAEALQVLLKRMEDDRDRLVVVLAGYPKPLTRLIQSNPGLASRFGRHFAFPDYTEAELGRIFESLCRKNRYELPPLVRVKLLLGFHDLLKRRDERFGNGRLARNVFEQAIGRLANRIAGIAPLTREVLTTLQPADIAIDDVADAVWADLDSKTRCLRSTCPHCQHHCRVPQLLLGQRVHCKQCQGESFQVDWADVIEE
jgi:SpoVK/Ycf46/Vps4 family AAA+-type ATPase